MDEVFSAFFLKLSAEEALIWIEFTVSRFRHLSKTPHSEEATTVQLMPFQKIPVVVDSLKLLRAREFLFGDFLISRNHGSAVIKD